MNYRVILEEHLNMYNQSVLQIVRKQITEEWLKFFEPSKDTKWCEYYYRMAMSRMRLLIDWLIRNEIFVKMHNSIGKEIEIDADDSDNLGIRIAPKDHLAYELMSYLIRLNGIRRDKYWEKNPKIIEEIISQIRIWYRKLRCTRLKQEHGFYVGKVGTLKWNKCLNMIRIQFILISVIRETMKFYTRIIDIIEERDSQEMISYKWDRELFFEFKGMYLKYKDSTEDVNYGASITPLELIEQEESSEDEEEQDDWLYEEIKDLITLRPLRTPRINN